MIRRAIKLPDAPNHLGKWEPTYLGGDGITKDSRGLVVPRIEGIWHTRTGEFIKCPYQVGETYFVKEKALYWEGGAAGIQDVVYMDDPDFPDYKRDNNALLVARETTNILAGEGVVGKWKIRPSTHMPQWASRIKLEIVGVSVELVAGVGQWKVEVGRIALSVCVDNQRELI